MGVEPCAQQLGITGRPRRTPAAPLGFGVKAHQMDVDGAIGVLGLLLHWRITLCIAVSTVAAYFAVQSFTWLTGLQGIVIASLGLGFGAMWDARATNKSTAVAASDSQTSTAVAVTAAVIAGATWGLFSSTSMHSFVAGTFLLLAGACWWHWFVCSRHAWVSHKRARICIFSAACAYAVGALVSHYAL